MSTTIVSAKDEVIYSDSFRYSNTRLLDKYCDHPSGFLAMNSATQHFSLEGSEGFIAYRDDGKFLFQMGGVISHDDKKETLLRAFVEFAKTERRKIACVQLRSEQISLYEKYGFTINQMGMSYSTDLSDFKTTGAIFAKMRNKIKRAVKLGIEIRELGKDEPNSEDVRRQVDEITDSWLESKGEKKLLQFMVGELSEHTSGQRRMFLAYQNKKVIGFASYVPSYGQFSGMMHDLSRRVDGAPPGVMELINITAINRFKEEGLRYINFGLTPFFGVNKEHDSSATRSKFLSWLFGVLEKHGQKIYPAISQVQYKRKWQPMTETPEFVAFQNGFNFSCFIRLLKLTESI